MNCFSQYAHMCQRSFPVDFSLVWFSLTSWSRDLFKSRFEWFEFGSESKTSGGNKLLRKFLLKCCFWMCSSTVFSMNTPWQCGQNFAILISRQNSRSKRSHLCILPSFKNLILRFITISHFEKLKFFPKNKKNWKGFEAI